MQNHKMWVEKYRPNSLSQYIFKDSELRNFVDKCIANQSIPHILFSGVQGTGKSTLIKLMLNLCNVLPEDIKVINASDENSVDMVRTTIMSYATTFAMGNFKVIVLEEADRLSIDAQKALKMIMETSADNLRFVFTSNHVHKLIPELNSRTQHFKFHKTDVNDIAEYIATILVSEQVSFTLDLIDQYVAIGYPDIRKIVHTVQQSTVDGQLTSPKDVDSSIDYRVELLSHIEEGNWVAARKLLCGTVDTEEWEEVYRFLYNNIHKCPTFNYDSPLWDEAIILISTHLTNNSISADPEINAASMLIQLKQLHTTKGQ